MPKEFKFTKKEIKLINDTVEALAVIQVRPAVLIGLAAHLIGFTAHCGEIPVDTVKKLVCDSVEYQDDDNKKDVL